MKYRIIECIDTHGSYYIVNYLKSYSFLGFKWSRWKLYDPAPNNPRSVIRFVSKDLAKQSLKNSNLAKIEKVGNYRVVEEDEL